MMPQLVVTTLKKLLNTIVLTSLSRPGKRQATDSTELFSGTGIEPDTLGV